MLKTLSTKRTATAMTAKVPEEGRAAIKEMTEKMSNGNGTKPIDWRSEGMRQLFQAPVYVLLIMLIGLILYNNSKESQRRLDIEEARNEKMGALFETIKDSTLRNANAMEEIAKEAKSEATQTKAQVEAIQERNKLLREQNDILRRQKGN